MINSKLTWPAVIVLILLLTGVVFTVQVFGVRNRINSSVARDKFEILDKPKDTSLVSNNNYLNIVMLRMKNPGIENNGAFTFELFDDQGNQIRQIVFNGMNIGDPGDLRFQFEPIDDSAGKEYRFVVTPDEAQPRVLIEVSKNQEISYTSYFRTINKTLAIRSFISLLMDKFIANSGFFSFWLILLFAILACDLKRK